MIDHPDDPPSKPDGDRKPAAARRGHDLPPRGRRIIKKPPVRRRQAVPMEYAGKWITWSADHMRILGHGETIQEAKDSAGNLPGLILMFVPPPGRLRPICKDLIKPGPS